MFSYCSNSGDFRYGNPGMSASDSGIKCADGFPIPDKSFNTAIFFNLLSPGLAFSHYLI